ncbi:flavodoxin [Leuconostoc rapi]|uniref:flavodoxin n=1 Tax=Leuconostoc rapi TaxID=1406906 RepID=UPI00195EDBA2|nr:flavodoxin [Leuconostoc rapi]MBM7436135.1 flavodoxin [Leuconostoc rapi]
MIIYFSQGGHTKKVAEQIAKKTGDQLYAIEPVEPYPSKTIQAIPRISREIATQTIPSVKKAPADVLADDVIYLGYPMFGMDMAHAMRGFLQVNDLSSKVIKPFMTSGTSTLKMSLKTLKKLAPNSVIDETFDPKNL